MLNWKGEILLRDLKVSVDINYSSEDNRWKGVGKIDNHCLFPIFHDIWDSCEPIETDAGKIIITKLLGDCFDITGPIKGSFFDSIIEKLGRC